MIPIQSESTPVKPIEISKPVFALENVESKIADITLESPITNHCIRPTSTAIRISPIQM